MPPGTSGKTQMTYEETCKTSAVANQRIHVERAIERIKRYRLITSKMELLLMPIADDIVKTTAGLCNIALECLA